MRIPLKLRFRIFIPFALLIIVSTVIFGTFAYQENVKTAEENFTNLLSGALDQTSINLNTLLFEVESQSRMFANNFAINDILNDYENKSYIEQYDRFQLLEKTMATYERPDRFLNIRLLFDREIRFMNDGIRYIYRDNEKQEADSFWLQRSNRIRWQVGELARLPINWNFGGMVLSVHADIYHQQNIGEKLGTVSFDLSIHEIRKLLTEMNIQPVYNVYVLHPTEGVIVSRNGKKEMELSEEQLVGITQSPSGKFVSSDKSNQHTDHIILYRQLNQYPLWVVAEVPISEITTRSNAILKQFLTIAIAVIMGSFILAFLIAGGVTQRIKRLVKAMGTLEKNNFNVRINDSRNDEIGVLSQKFDWMTERIKNLIHDVNKTYLQKREAEMNLLHAQINPHFLYNTLDGIHWLAKKYKADEISYMIRNLSEFLRLSLNIDKEVTIETEIKHVLAYFNIQQYRFEDRVNLIIEIPQMLYHYKTLAIILQPLVENALLHGILKEEGRSGTVTIRGELMEDMIMLEVSDDGIGMDEQRFREVTEHIVRAPNEALGKGILNVHQRIRIHYGEEYGLNLAANKHGTSCILIFPVTRI